MQQLAELIPLLFFFAVFFLKDHSLQIGPLHLHSDGLMSATLVLVIASLVMLIAIGLRQRRLEKRLLLVTGLAVLMGILTLVFQNKDFIFWKPTVFNWGMALAFIGSRLLFRKSLMQITLGSQFQAPAFVWLRLELVWVTQFLIVGALNLFVAYRFSEAAWVSYKLYSAIGFTLLLTLLTAALIAPYLPKDEDTSSQPPHSPV